VIQSENEPLPKGAYGEQSGSCESSCNPVSDAAVKEKGHRKETRFLMDKALQQKIDELIKIDDPTPQQEDELEALTVKALDWDAEWQRLKRTVQKLEGKRITNLEFMRRYVQLVYGEHYLVGGDSDGSPDS